MAAMLDDPRKPNSTKSKLQVARAVCTDAALALFATVAIGLITASLAAAGVITMNLAYTPLVLAWAVVLIGSFFVTWPISNTHRTIFAAFFAFMLFLLGYYETKNYEKPLSAKEIVTEVLNGSHDIMAVLPPTTGSQAPVPALPVPPANRSLSTISKTLYRCHRVYPAILDKSADKKQMSEMRERLQIVGDTLGMSITLANISHGLRMEFEPKSREGQIRMAGVQKTTFEFKRIGDDVFVSVLTPLPGILGIRELSG